MNETAAAPTSPAPVDGAKIDAMKREAIAIGDRVRAIDDLIRKLREERAGQVDRYEAIGGEIGRILWDGVPTIRPF